VTPNVIRPASDEGRKHGRGIDHLIYADPLVDGVREPDVARPVEHGGHVRVIGEEPEIGAVGHPPYPRIAPQYLAMRCREPLDKRMVGRRFSRFELALEPLDPGWMLQHPVVLLGRVAHALFEGAARRRHRFPGNTPNLPSATTSSATVLCHSPPRMVPMLTGAT
jgi:hypothetical protein